MKQIYVYKVTETVEYTYKVEAGDRESALDKLESLGHTDAFSHKVIDKDTDFVECEELMTEDDDSDAEDMPVNERLEDEKAAETRNEL